MGIDVTVATETSRYEPDDPGWRDQVATLYTALRDIDAPVQVRGGATIGAKGTLDTVVITLASSGVLTAIVSCFRAWLARDKTRTITVVWTDESGAEQHIALTADNIDAESLQALANTIGGRVGNT